jgi:GINS complex subunit 1
MNYGQHGRNLLLELKRSEPGNTDSTASTIPSYNDVLVTNALQDLRLHHQALQDQVEANTIAATDSDAPPKPSQQVKPSLLLQHAAIQRNKRCLLTYHVVRLQRIQDELYWRQQHLQQQQKQPLSDKASASTIAKNPNLCPAEQDFLNKYEDLLHRYTAAATNQTVTDLRAHTSMPPQPSDRVLIRVLTDDIGAIVLESGASAVLSQGSTHFLIYTDVEEYIRQGKVQVLNGEEEEE